MEAVRSTMLTNSEPDNITAVTEDLAAVVLPPPRPASPFQGDASLLTGKYKGRGRGAERIIDVSQTQESLAFSLDGAAAAPLPRAGKWTFRRGGSLLMFRRSGNKGPATEPRFDTAGGHFNLQRQ